MVRKRFIAGAACPVCKEQDGMRWWEENNIEKVECVHCGHKDERVPKSMEKSEHSSEGIIGVFKPD